MREDEAPGGRAFWLTTAVGMGIVAFGLLGLLRHSAQTVPANFAKFFVGSLVVHDLLWAPVVGLASLLFVRVVPRTVRPVLQGTLVVTVAVVLVAIPVLTGRGRNPNNPSILPGDYGTDLLKVLLVVWIAGAAVALLARRRPPTAVDPPRPWTDPRPPGNHGW